MSDWLLRKNFTMRSGSEATWKAECDALTDGEIETFAYLIASGIGPFNGVWGIPRGGLRLEMALRPLITPGAANCLLVDDVFTTGASMVKARDKLTIGGGFRGKIQGAVMFARGPTPKWIMPVWRLDPRINQ